jgi:hypothetical protein
MESQVEMVADLKKLSFLEAHLLDAHGSRGCLPTGSTRNNNQEGDVSPLAQ